MGVPVLSAATGGLAGASIALEHAGNKANEKYMKAATRYIDRLRKVNEAIDATSDKVKPQDRQKYLDLLKKVEKKLQNSREALERFEKRSGKIVNKATLKGGLKGVAVVKKLRAKKAFAKNVKIGAGIAAGAAAVGTGAYLAKKYHDKKKNEKKD